MGWNGMNGQDGPEPCLLPLEKFGGVLQSLGPAVARCVALEEISVPVLSALQLAFPRAKCVSMQLLVGNMLFVSVNNFLEGGPTTATLLVGDKSLTGLAAAQRTPVTATLKGSKTVLTDVAYAAEKYGATRLTAVPLLASDGEPGQPLEQLLEAIKAGGNVDGVLDLCQDVLQGKQCCIGTISVGVDHDAIDGELAARHLKNLLMLGISVTPHAVCEGLRLINGVAQLLGLTQPGRLYDFVPGHGHTEIDECGDPIPESTAVAVSVASEDREAEEQYSDLDEDYIRELLDEDLTDDDELSNGTACHTDDLPDFDDFDGAAPCPLVNLHSPPEEPEIEEDDESPCVAQPMIPVESEMGGSSSTAQDAATASSSQGQHVAGPDRQHGPSKFKGPAQTDADAVEGIDDGAKNKAAPGTAASGAELAHLQAEAADSSMHWLWLNFSNAALEHRFLAHTRHSLRWMLSLLLPPLLCSSLSLGSLSGATFTPTVGFVLAHMAMCWVWTAQCQFRNVLLVQYLKAAFTLAAFKRFPALDVLAVAGSSLQLSAVPAMWRLCRLLSSLLPLLAMVGARGVGAAGDLGRASSAWQCFSPWATGLQEDNFVLLLR